MSETERQDIAAMTFPTTARRLAMEAYRVVLRFRIDLNALIEEPMESEVYHRLGEDLHDRFLRDLTAMFESVEPLVQAENKQLKAMWAEHIRLCVESRVVLPTLLSMGLEEMSK